MKARHNRWSARFDRPVAASMQRFNASLPFDQRLLTHELEVSRAHARMLGATGVIAAGEARKIVAGLNKLDRQARAGKFSWKLEEEDIHTAVERRLTTLIGVAGKKLHTARSRNDQVATVVRLWLRDQIAAQRVLLAQARLSLLELAAKHVTTIMPGFTHLQVAQPTTLAHALHAHACALARDETRLWQCRERVNVMPLGACALAGTSFAIKPKMVAKELGFAALCPNSMDAVADRDFVLDYGAFAVALMVHLSRLAEELVVWASQPFGFVRIADAFSTGSSIMPQKRNPDAAELIRGKSGRVLGSYVALATMLKGQPLAYNKDNQEDKERLFDSVDTVATTLEVTAPLVASLRFDVAKMAQATRAGYAVATELADLLVRSGEPFRDAHAKVAAVVNAAEKQGVALDQLKPAELRRLTGVGTARLRRILDPAAAVASRKTPGAPAPKLMQATLAAELKQLKASLRRLGKKQGR